MRPRLSSGVLQAERFSGASFFVSGRFPTGYHAHLRIPARSHKQKMTKSILIVDDHPVVLFGLRFLFEDRRDLAICGEAGDAVLARRMAEVLQPDFVVLDLVLGGRDGLELLREVAEVAPRSRVLVYSSQSAQVLARKCRGVGAWGYVSKTEGLPLVAKAIDSIRSGIPFFPGLDPPDPSRQGLEMQALIAQLSIRETQVLRMLGDRLSTQQISQALGVSVSTIGTYRERIKTKLALSSVRDLDDAARDYVADRLVR